MTTDGLTTADDAATIVTVRRTRLRVGCIQKYQRLHARIPNAVMESLREHGVLHWTIWRQGRDLIHIVETDRPWELFLEGIQTSPPVDEAWDRRIQDLLEPDEDRLLSMVWGMDSGGQWAAADDDDTGRN
jgi:L-rhamnose mutarotase